MQADLLAVVTPIGWFRLALALVLFAGPGLVLGELLQVGRRLDRTQAVALAFPASLALWAVLLGLLQLVDLSLPAPAVWAWCGAGWLLFAWRRWRARDANAERLLRDGSLAGSLLLWLVVAATAAVSLWALRGVVVQPGSDGYHHTLIAQAIATAGGLPDNLLPLTPLVSFTYHFGYHAFVAGINWLTDIPVVALVPLLAQLLKAAMALGVALLAEAMGRRRSGGIVAATVAGLIAVFPAYYVNWGRNTQLTGLLILAALLALLWLWATAKPSLATAGVVAVLAAGMALAHYRVALMAAIGCTLVAGGGALAARWPRREWGLRLRDLGVMGTGALLLVAPWAWHVVAAQQVGYPATVADPAPMFFRLERLGALVLEYPTNWPLLALLATALLWGAWRRDRSILLLAAWMLAMLLLSLPGGLGEYMDTITVVQSLFLPAAVIIGLAAGDFAATAGAYRWRRWAVAAVTGVLALAGARSIAGIVETGAPYVLPADLPAVAWVRAHTPPGARFMVNTFRFDFLPDYVLGGDAGSWLPVLAERAAVTAPMTYAAERVRWPDYSTRINALADLGGNLATPEAVARLRQEGVTHVYLGARGGPLSLDALLASPDYELVYQHGPVAIFQLRPVEGE